VAGAHTRISRAHADGGRPSAIRGGARGVLSSKRDEHALEVVKREGGVLVRREMQRGRNLVELGGGAVDTERLEDELELIMSDGAVARVSKEIKCRLGGVARRQQPRRARREARGTLQRP